MAIVASAEELRQQAGVLGQEVRATLEERYLAADPRPWIIGFSGGKDSTLVAQLVFEMLLQVPPRRRSRRVYVLSSDTLVETPQVVGLVKENVALIDRAAASLGLPVESVLVTPEVNDTYWVRVIGYGYPPPSRLMRWCTDRLKIQPANRFILSKISEHGEVTILLGARYEESAARAQSLARHEDGGGLHKHTTLPNAYVLSPIRHFTTEQVWAYLVFNPSPWGGDNIKLRDLYKSSNANECPLVIDETTEPCGNSRFGCYTCTVVERDRSLEGFVEAGREDLRDLLDLRNWLVELRDNHDNRMSTRRNGQPGVGPLKIEVRRQLLERLLAVQDRYGEELIAPAEVAEIRRVWIAEAMTGHGPVSGQSLAGVPLPLV